MGGLGNGEAEEEWEEVEEREEAIFVTVDWREDSMLRFNTPEQIMDVRLRTPTPLFSG